MDVMYTILISILRDGKQIQGRTLWILHHHRNMPPYHLVDDRYSAVIDHGVGRAVVSADATMKIC